MPLVQNWSSDRRRLLVASLIAVLTVALGAAACGQPAKPVIPIVHGLGDTAPNGTSYPGTVSNDGKRISFTSDASNLVPGDTNGVRDLFVYDRTTGLTERVNVSGTGQQSNADTLTVQMISGDGNVLAYLDPGLDPAPPP
jgi:hypothetical protein